MCACICVCGTPEGALLLVLVGATRRMHPGKCTPVGTLMWMFSYGRTGYALSVVASLLAHIVILYAPPKFDTAIANLYC